VFSPSLYHSGPEENARLAEEVYQRLNAHKADNPSMGEVRRHQRLATSHNTLLYSNNTKSAWLNDRSLPENTLH
jgi:hypothetical protein